MTKEEYSNIVSNFTNLMKLTISDDDEFNSESQKQILERDKNYTELLKHFVTTTQDRNKSKEKYKWWYFKIIMALLVLLNILICIVITVLLIKCDASQLISAIPVFITAIGGFVASIIAIPLSITQYLFSTEEDKYTTEIISHTQEHDLSSRRILKALAENVINDEQSA